MLVGQGEEERLGAVDQMINGADLSMAYPFARSNDRGYEIVRIRLIATLLKSGPLIDQCVAQIRAWRTISYERL